MNKQVPIARVINLIAAESQRLWTIDESEARRRLLASRPEDVLQLDGSFALVAQDGSASCWRGASTARCATFWRRPPTGRR